MNEAGRKVYFSFCISACEKGYFSALPQPPWESVGRRCTLEGYNEWEEEANPEVLRGSWSTGISVGMLLETKAKRKAGLDGRSGVWGRIEYEDERSMRNLQILHLETDALMTLTITLCLLYWEL